MPGINDTIVNLMENIAKPGVIDRINEPDQQEKINNLSDEEQNLLAQKIVIQWIENDYDSRELLSLKRDIPASKHDKELTGFSFYMNQAVNIFACFDKFCADGNRHPFQMIHDEELTSDIFDDLNGMPELKACMVEHVINPSIDSIISKIADKDERAQLSKFFRNERAISESLNAANVVRDWVDTLKGETPWALFDERGVNSDVFIDHADLVMSMISNDDAQSIGAKLQATPSEVAAYVAMNLYRLGEAFRGLNRLNNAENVFETMSCVMAKTRPSAEDIKAEASKLSGMSMFSSSSTVELESPDSQYQPNL